MTEYHIDHCVAEVNDATMLVATLNEDYHDISTDEDFGIAVIQYPIQPDLLFFDLTDVPETINSKVVVALLSFLEKEMIPQEFNCKIKLRVYNKVLLDVILSRRPKDAHPVTLHKWTLDNKDFWYVKPKFQAHELN